VDDLATPFFCVFFPDDFFNFFGLAAAILILPSPSTPVDGI
jgi:hypothetical protein